MAAVVTPFPSRPHPRNAEAASALPADHKNATLRAKRYASVCLESNTANGSLAVIDAIRSSWQSNPAKAAFRSSFPSATGE